MPKEFSRTVRVADQIQRNLAQLIQTQLADPRLGMVNINAVEVARDYSVAKVYVTIIGASNDNDAESKRQSSEAVEALNHAANHLRSLLAKSLNARTTPRLLFLLDSAAIEGRKLSDLIDQAVAADRSHHEHNDHH